jgi:hypothetical protein
MADSCLLHLNKGAISISNYFYLIDGRRIESWKVTGDQSKLSGHERFYISVTHACEVGDPSAGIPSILFYSGRTVTAGEITTYE